MVIVPRLIRMPSLNQLPNGPRRAFVGSLHGAYRMAGEPTLAQIVDAINANEDRVGTGSRETVRRLLRGETVSSFENARTVFEALWALAGLKGSDIVVVHGREKFTRLEEFAADWEAAYYNDDDDAVTYPKKALGSEPDEG